MIPIQVRKDSAFLLCHGRLVLKKLYS